MSSFLRELSPFFNFFSSFNFTDFIYSKFQKVFPFDFIFWISKVFPFEIISQKIYKYTLVIFRSQKCESYKFTKHNKFIKVRHDKLLRDHEVNIGENYYAN